MDENLNLTQDNLNKSLVLLPEFGEGDVSIFSLGMGEPAFETLVELETSKNVLLGRSSLIGASGGGVSS